MRAVSHELLVKIFDTSECQMFMLEYEKLLQEYVKENQESKTIDYFLEYAKIFYRKKINVSETLLTR